MTFGDAVEVGADEAAFAFEAVAADAGGDGVFVEDLASAGRAAGFDFDFFIGDFEDHFLEGDVIEPGRSAGGAPATEEAIDGDLLEAGGVESNFEAGPVGGILDGFRYGVAYAMDIELGASCALEVFGADPTGEAVFRAGFDGGLDEPGDIGAAFGGDADGVFAGVSDRGVEREGGFAAIGVGGGTPVDGLVVVGVLERGIGEEVRAGFGAEAGGDALVMGGYLEGVEEPVILAVGFIAEEVGDGDREHGVFRELGHFREGCAAGVEVGGGDDGGIEEELDIVGSGAEGLDGVATDHGIGIEEGGLMDFAIEFTEAMERPERVDCGDAAAGDLAAERLDRGFVMVLDEETLGGEAPELVGVAERFEEFIGGGVGERGGVGFGGAVFPDEAVDTSVLAVAIGVDMGVALAVFAAVAAAFGGGGGVMLDDEVVPIRDPEVAIGADFGGDGGEPFIGAGYDRESVDGFIAGAVRDVFEHTEEVSGGAADEGHRVTPGWGELGGGGEGVTCAGGVLAEGVDLADVGGDGVEVGGIGDHFGGHAWGIRVGGGGEGAEEGGVGVGGGAEDIAGGVEAETPGIVIELVEKRDV